MTEMKKQHSLPRVRLMRRAAVIRRNNDMNRRDALIIAHRISFHRPYMPRPENTFVVYYDLEAKGWRTFHAENFLCVE